jgi:fructose-1,6-bisphosphatase II
MDRNLALEFVRVTEAGAIAAARWMGKGDKIAADGAAVKEMRDRFNGVAFQGEVIIGEGGIDEAPELFIGEKLGTGEGPEMDIAVDPLEATESVAWGRANAISVIATGAKGSLLKAPEIYMEKLAVGPEAKGAIDLNAPIGDNIKKVAKKLGKEAGEVTAIVLDRPRHEQLIKDIRKAGARVRLITDGDVAGAMAASLPGSGSDILAGIGKSPEAVLAAVGIKALGGDMQVRFSPRDDKDKKLIEECGQQCGIKNIDDVLQLEDLAKGNELTFTATGVLDGPLARGVRFEGEKIITHSVVMRVKSGTIRHIEAHHCCD